MNIFNIKKFIKNKLYIKNNYNLKNIKLTKYVYKIYKNIIILDVIQIRKCILNVFFYFYFISKLNKNILFISSNLFFKFLIKKISLLTSNYYIINKWKYGILTNWINIKNKLLLLKWFNLIFYNILNKKLKKILTNKILIKIYKNIKKNIYFIKNLPKTVFILNPFYDKKALLECKLLNINIISISYIPLNFIKYIIPSNYNILSLNLIFEILILPMIYNFKFY